ncbi:hypothetical protein TPY_2773 [Sulfobacillus acidophilus TPY]|uniref:Uncharacterized protein n=1 Tax=Sulfobacillus acidophilus (strain ATCC 700253 / DSM 10332 / NAL) TaxID=679936 RepID=G8TU16_SULAD|nr:hypothetical protein TPY_2773 [Sulfobacillus acidophilus TPY]AEW04607.1 hypothetical protein Sulac_1107 [Sulfobacillus acidophilus DSM 10332]
MATPVEYLSTTLSTMSSEPLTKRRGRPPLPPDVRAARAEARKRDAIRRTAHRRSRESLFRREVRKILREYADLVTESRQTAREELTRLRSELAPDDPNRQAIISANLVLWGKAEYDLAQETRDALTRIWQASRADATPASQAVIDDIYQTALKRLKPLTPLPEHFVLGYILCGTEAGFQDRLAVARAQRQAPEWRSPLTPIIDDPAVAHLLAEDAHQPRAVKSHGVYRQTDATTLAGRNVIYEQQRAERM